MHRHRVRSAPKPGCKACALHNPVPSALNPVGVWRVKVALCTSEARAAFSSKRWEEESYCTMPATPVTKALILSAALHRAFGRPHEDRIPLVAPSARARAATAGKAEAPAAGRRPKIEMRPSKTRAHVMRSLDDKSSQTLLRTAEE